MSNRNSPYDIAIVGAGLAGLLVAWFLEKKGNLKIALFEKEDRAGGWVDTHFYQGIPLERGPHSIRLTSSSPIYSYLEELDLKPLFASDAAKNRFLLLEGKLVKIPSSPLDFLKSKDFRGMVLAFLKEPFIKPKKEDESIYDFGLRRFNKKVADLLLDPLTLGIFAGDPRVLSYQSSFPLLYAQEQKEGSLVKALMKKREKAQLIHFEGGMRALIEALKQKLKAPLFLEEPVTHLEKKGHLYELKTTHQKITAKKVILALSLNGVKKILPQIATPTLPYASLNVVHAVYTETRGPKGFGYLVPSHQHKPYYGVIFDSHVFPQGPYSVFTVMMPVQENPTLIATQALHETLGLSPEKLLYQESFFAHECIPHFPVGFSSALASFQEVLHSHFEGVEWLHSVGVPDAFAKAQTLAHQLYEP